MRLTVIALLLVMSGTATAVAQTAKQNRPAQTQTGHCDVGVVSNLTKFKIKDAGTSDPAVVVPVEPWHLDEVVVDTVRAALGNRLVVQRIPYRGEKVESRPFLLWQLTVQVRPSIRQLASGTRCSRYVFVEEDSVALNDSVRFYGIGIYGSVLHVVIRARLYDGETFKALLLNPSTYATGRAPESVTPGRAAQNTQLREATQQLLVRSLNEELSARYNLGLFPPMKELLVRARTAAP